MGAAALLCALLAGCGGAKAPATSPLPQSSAQPQFVPVPAEDLPTSPAVPPSPSPASPAEPAPYHVAPEDVLEISVYGDPELTRQVPVRPDGNISYTFVGDVAAAGRTIEEIRDELKRRLGAFLRTPEVTVIAREFGKQKVYVAGEITAPGVFYITPRENTLADVVFRAGIGKGDGDLSKAVLVRSGKMVPVDFEKLLRGDMTENIRLQDGDVIFIPEAAERWIYVLGEVRNANAIETTVPLSITNVLTRSGGVNPVTGKSKEIAILRGGLKQPLVAVVDFRRLLEGDMSQNIQVRPGDIVYVPTTGLGKYNQFVEQILKTFSLLFQGRVVQQGF